MPDYNGLGDRLETKGSPYSANNGAKPVEALKATGILSTNNTFTGGNYSDFVVDAETGLDTKRAQDAGGTRELGTRG